jgi:hypothetical protein
VHGLPRLQKFDICFSRFSIASLIHLPHLGWDLALFCEYPAPYWLGFSARLASGKTELMMFGWENLPSGSSWAELLDFCRRFAFVSFEKCIEICTNNWLKRLPINWKCVNCNQRANVLQYFDL